MNLRDVTMKYGRLGVFMIWWFKYGLTIVIGTLKIMANAGVFVLVSPTHKRTEGRAPVWGSEFTSKDAALQGGRRNCC
jgi:hypothetical protein